MLPSERRRCRIRLIAAASSCGLLHLVAAYCVARAPSGAPSRALAPGRPFPHPSRRLDYCGSLRLVAAHADSRPPGPSRPSRVRVVASEQPHPLTVSGSPHPRHRLRVTASESRPRHHIGAAASSHHIRATASESRHARHRIRVAASESPPPSRRGSGCRRVRVGQASPRPRRRVGRRAR